MPSVVGVSANLSSAGVANRLESWCWSAAGTWTAKCVADLKWGRLGAFAPRTCSRCWNPAR